MAVTGQPIVVRIYPTRGDGRNTRDGWSYSTDRMSGGAYDTPEQAVEACRRSLYANRHSYGNDPQITVERGRYVTTWVPDDARDTQ